MPPPRKAQASQNPSMYQQLHGQWGNPNDVLTLLLLVGGDVIQQALAQQSGDKLPTLVVFSFGWVAYTFTALLSAVAGGRLMPSPPAPASIVISTEYGYARANESWILNRILRDYEKSWMPVPVKEKLQDMLTAEKKGKAGLCIAVFEASKNGTAGIPQRDLYWFSGYVVALLQLAVAVIPWRINGDWEIFLLTAAGTALAFITGSFSQWRHERWCCRRNSSKTFVLTRGNGAQHALVIQGAGRGLDLEDLAAMTDRPRSSWETKVVFAALTTCWVVLLLTASGIRNQSWILLAIGATGTIHTVVVAGVPRRPEWFGIHLDYRAVFVERKVMATLQAAEISYPGLGRSMLSTFFPGPLREEEERWWDERGKEIPDQKVMPK